jgi:carbonic anhydrase/acetyltransferase-like protein (isoleucine patch superfamily)
MARVYYPDGAWRTTLATIKLIIAIACAILPMNALRVLAYRFVGYRIHGTRIGFGTIIAVDAADLEECRIGWFNLFVGPMSVTVRPGASVGNLNKFICGFWTVREGAKGREYARTLVLEKESVITSGHYFDVAGSFTLGERSWIAGTGSQFWTHGAGVQERNIRIGEESYVGSAVRFAPGAGIERRVIVALGSVVARTFKESHVMLGGVPATVLKTDHDWMSADRDPAVGDAY